MDTSGRQLRTTMRCFLGKIKLISNSNPGQNLLCFSTDLIRYKLPQELPNDVKLRILGDQEILGKSQNWVITQLSAQSLLQNWSFGNSGQ